MCTAAIYHTKDYYFGRNLDLEYHYQETVSITPRNYVFSFCCLPPLRNHYAMIGMSTIADGYPLYYDATNEYGLSMAALNFPVSARYLPQHDEKLNVAPFELIPYILGTCRTLAEAEKKLLNINITDIAFSQAYPVTPLHWFLADKSAVLTIEPTEQGLQLYDNPVGVLANEPPFPYHMTNLQNYMHVTNEKAVNRFAPSLKLDAYSSGMGGIGLPGDLSSASRFVKAAFTKMNSVSKDSESASVSQLFHILGSVAQQQGCVKVGNLYEKTIYTSCCNTTKGIYYYTTYENSQITGVRLHGVDLNTDTISVFPLRNNQSIHMEN